MFMGVHPILMKRRFFPQHPAHRQVCKSSQSNAGGGHEELPTCVCMSLRIRTGSGSGRHPWLLLS